MLPTIGHIHLQSAFRSVHGLSSGELYSARTLCSLYYHSSSHVNGIFGLVRDCWKTIAWICWGHMLNLNSREVGRSLRALRADCGIGLRELCRLAAISPAALSSIETGRSSPTLATLHRILKAMGHDFGSFFGAASTGDSPAFISSEMACVNDGQRECIFAFPRRAGIRFAMAKETFPAEEKRSEWETHDCDVGGIIISGGPLLLEIKGREASTLREGDAFYIKAGLKHRGRNIGNSPLRLITTYEPPRY
jgi:transcriptional regulator with XRE-family HTH domain